MIANAQTLGQKFALNLGIEDEERWVDWCKVLSDAAAFGKERGVQVVVKHHHGLNNTSHGSVAWIKQVNHPNFGVFFDPGNVVYYTGKDPVKQLEIIGPHVIGVVAKDCSAPHFMERAVGDPPFGTKVAGAGNPEVMIQFGTGKVDFPGFFKRLKSLVSAAPFWSREPKWPRPSSRRSPTPAPTANSWRRCSQPCSARRCGSPGAVHQHSHESTPLRLLGMLVVAVVTVHGQS